MKNLAIILTAHNRKNKTLACLESVYQQNDGLFPVNYDVYLTDDGSTDGTADAVRAQFPQVRMLPGTGHLYWNGGMRLAFGEAMKRDYDFYLWLNDDTMLFQDSVHRLLETSQQFEDKAIIVGSIQDPDTKSWSYGGVIRQDRIRPFKFSSVKPGVQPIPIDTMNGNCVLIPKNVANLVGNLDPVFTHKIGDRDYGLRTKKLGIPIYLAPEYFGYCKRDPQVTYPKSVIKSVMLLLSKKMLPPKEYFIYVKRHGGPFYLFYFFSPYVRKLVAFIKKR